MISRSGDKRDGAGGLDDAADIVAVDLAGARRNRRHARLLKLLMCGPASPT